MQKLLRNLPDDNKRKASTVYAKIGKEGKFVPSTESKCAERNALPLFLKENYSFARTTGYHNKKIDILIVRLGIDNDGKKILSMSHPCTNCRAYLRLVERKFHISFKITYSTRDGGFETKVTDELEYYERPKERRRARGRNKKKL
jgi:hypothetical protein